MSSSVSTVAALWSEDKLPTVHQATILSKLYRRETFIEAELKPDHHYCAHLTDGNLLEPLGEYLFAALVLHGFIGAAGSDKHRFYITEHGIEALTQYNLSRALQRRKHKSQKRLPTRF